MQKYFNFSHLQDNSYGNDAHEEAISCDSLENIQFSWLPRIELIEYLKENELAKYLYNGS